MPCTVDCKRNTGFSPTLILFSKRFTPAPPLAARLEATIRSRSSSFQAELIPVRSPLLRECCLVYFPPLTYMLKFSGFADLISGCTRNCNHCDATRTADKKSFTCYLDSYRKCVECATASYERGVAHKERKHQSTGITYSTSTETGILPGISRECNARSRIHWFTEFCNSQ